MSRATVKKIMDQVNVVNEGPNGFKVVMDYHEFERLLLKHIHDAPLRDNLAKSALNGILSSRDSWGEHDFKPINGLTHKENTAVLAYLYADAMMKARDLSTKDEL